MGTKCVIVGNPLVGKATLANTYATGMFYEYSSITLFNTIRAKVKISRTTYELTLQLTPGQEDYERSRPLCYEHTDVILMCFSVSCPYSYKRVKQYWVPEVRRHSEAPILLVGTKTDLRNDPFTLERLKKCNEAPVLVAHGERLAKEIKAIKYIECSALKLEGLDNVMEEAIYAAKRFQIMKLKFVFVGDSCVGKMSLVRSYVRNVFPTEYVPTVSEIIHHSMIIENTKYNLELHLTAGQDHYHCLRTLQYPQTDVFLLCFSISDRNSYTNIKEKWIPEVRKHCQKTPILLVGTKTDERHKNSTLQNESKENEVTLSVRDGERLAKEIKAIKYIECSAKKLQGLETVIEEAILAAKQIQFGTLNKDKCKVS